MIEVVQGAVPDDAVPLEPAAARKRRAGDLAGALALHVLSLAGMVFAVLYVASYLASISGPGLIVFLAGGAAIWLLLAAVVVRWWARGRQPLWQVPLAWLLLASLQWMVLPLLFWARCRAWLWRCCTPWHDREAGIAGASGGGPWRTALQIVYLELLPIVLILVPIGAVLVVFDDEKAVTADNCKGLLRSREAVTRIELNAVALDLPDAARSAEGWFVIGCRDEPGLQYVTTQSNRGPWNLRLAHVGYSSLEREELDASLSLDELVERLGEKLEFEVAEMYAGDSFRGLESSLARQDQLGMACVGLSAIVEVLSVPGREGESFHYDHRITECLAPAGAPDSVVIVRWTAATPPESEPPEPDEADEAIRELIEGLELDGE
jgi:hypothetical protein